MAGFLLDWVLLALIDIPVLIVTHSLHRTHQTVIDNGAVSHQTGFHIGAGGLVLQVLIGIVYTTLLVGSARGQTVGMMLVGVKAVDEHRGGSIGYARAAARSAFEYLMAVLLVVPWIIDMLFPLWDPKKQTLHDKVTKAVVVRT